VIGKGVGKMCRRDGEQWYHLRTALPGVAGKVLQAAGVAIPPPVKPAGDVVPKI